MAELVGVVVVYDPHPHRLGQIGKLRSDVAVAHDSERLAPDLVAILRRLLPSPGMRPGRFGNDPPQQHDDLADHQLRDAAGVGEWRIEDGNPHAARGVDVDLVGSDVEATDRNQPVGRLDDPRIDCVRERIPSR